MARLHAQWYVGLQSASCRGTVYGLMGVLTAACGCKGPGLAQGCHCLVSAAGVLCNPLFCTLSIA